MSKTHCPLCSPEPLPESTVQLICTVIGNEIDWFMLDQYRENEAFARAIDAEVRKLKDRLIGVFENALPVDDGEQKAAPSCTQGADPGADGAGIPDSTSRSPGVSGKDQLPDRPSNDGGEQDPAPKAESSRPKKARKPLKHLVIDWMGKENLTQEKAAKVIGISPPTLAGIIHGSQPRQQTLEKLAAVIPGVSA